MGEAEHILADPSFFGPDEVQPQLIVGIDEAGRGPWAGPVVAAAVILPPALGVSIPLPPDLNSLNDSKRLTERKRHELVMPICRLALGVGVGIQNAHHIDKLGIARANEEAMRIACHKACHALKRCGRAAHMVRLALIDGKYTVPRLGLDQQALIKGDQRSFHIAAASIIAKVTRDKIMVFADRKYPGYGFAKHKGYGTRVHQNALQTLGVTPLHRQSYRPIRELLLQQE